MKIDVITLNLHKLVNAANAIFYSSKEENRYLREAEINDLVNSGAAALSRHEANIMKRATNFYLEFGRSMKNMDIPAAREARLKAETCLTTSPLAVHFIRSGLIGRVVNSLPFLGPRPRLQATALQDLRNLSWNEIDSADRMFFPLILTFSGLAGTACAVILSHGILISLSNPNLLALAKGFVSLLTLSFGTDAMTADGWDRLVHPPSINLPF